MNIERQEPAPRTGNELQGSAVRGSSFSGSVRRPAPAAGRPAFLAAICAVLLAAHGALVLHHYPWRSVAEGNPVVSVELTFHMAGAMEGRDFIAKGGHIWGYSPRYMAGYPFGLWNSIGTRGYELSSSLMPWMSMSSAYYAWVVLTSFLPPLLIALAAALLGLGWAMTTRVLALAVVVWQADSMLSYFWTSGMIAFSFVDSMAVLFFALLFRCWDSKNWFMPLAAGLCLGAIFWLHTLVLLSAALAAGAIFLLRWRETTGAVMLRLGLAAVVAAAVAWPWLSLLLQFRDQRGYMDLARIAGGWKTFVMDWLSDRRYGFHFDRRSLLHAVAVLAALGALHSARTTGRAALGCGIAALLLAVCGYAFSMSRFLVQTEPYRYVGSAILFAIIPAAAGWQRLGELLRQANPAGRLAAACVALALLPSLSAYGFDLIYRVKHPAQGLDRDRLAVARWLNERRDVSGRVLCEDPKLGNALPFHTGQQVLGGTIGDESVLPHNWAGAGVQGPFGGFRRRVMEEGRLADYLRLFNVAFVVVETRDFEADMRAVADRYPLQARIGRYAVFAAAPAGLSYIWEGDDAGAAAVRAEPNRIVVDRAPKGTFVLKYHFLRTLVSTPGTRLAPRTVLNGPVPMIEVENPNGLEHIEIVQSY